MPRPPQPSAPPRPTSRQLPLPLDLPEGGLLARPAAPLVDIATHQVWPNLSPAMRARVRGALRRVLQEVVGDARER
jgi:hypothetical protein